MFQIFEIDIKKKYIIYFSNISINIHLKECNKILSIVNSIF